MGLHQEVVKEDWAKENWSISDPLPQCKMEGSPLEEPSQHVHYRRLMATLDMKKRYSYINILGEEEETGEAVLVCNMSMLCFLGQLPNVHLVYESFHCLTQVLDNERCGRQRSHTLHCHLPEGCHDGC
mmetsp:Transcript_18958/g.24400  ORF Transcript_18958/g.24400 Transcript_18958/m.24400 type:complete len:128 (+) Transcript_18958:167-550(+)